MPKTRPERTRADHRAEAAATWDDIAPYVAPAFADFVRRRVKRGHSKTAEKDIKTWTTVPDVAGDLVLLRTSSRKYPDVFRVMASTCADQRIDRAQRELPFGHLVEVARFPVVKVRTARRRIQARLEKDLAVTSLHDEYYEMSGGAESARGMVRRTALLVNGLGKIQLPRRVKQPQTA